MIPDQSDEPLLPLSSKEDHLRLFDAVSRVFEELRKLGLYPLGDDLQFFDNSSMELMASTIANAPSSVRVSSLAAYRPQEVSARFKEILGQMLEAGHATLIELEPLKATEIGEMLIGT